jgi:hypothetical protein
MSKRGNHKGLPQRLPQPGLPQRQPRRGGWFSEQIGVNQYALMIRSDGSWNDIIYMTLDATPEGIRQLTDHLNSTFFTPEGGDL